MTEKDQMLTYWPSSKNMYVGAHLQRDPGAGSPDLLATYKKVDSSYKAELKSAELIQSAKQVASATAVGNDANLEHLQVIRLQEEIMARPDQPFFLEQASTVRNIDMLEGRETWRSIGDSVRRRNRMEEAKEVKTSYDEVRYDISKIVGKVWTPQEDLLRTIRNPQEIDLENLMWDFAFHRNQELKSVIEAGITRGADGGNSATALGDIRTNTSNFHSTTNIANAISSAIKTFRVRNRLPITHAIFDPVGYDRYTSNTWTGSKAGPDNIEPRHFPNGGVTTLPGFPNITAIIEPELDAGDMAIYFLNKANALRTATGPSFYKQYWDEDRDVSVVKQTQYVKFYSIDKEINHSKIGNRYFSFKATYTTS